MKKRNVALVLAATMMLSLAGCAGSNEKTEDTKKAQTETENKTEGKEDAVQIDGALSITVVLECSSHSRKLQTLSRKRQAVR